MRTPKVTIGHTVEFVGQNPIILQGEIGEVVATTDHWAKVRFIHKKDFTWESWFLIDHLEKKE